MEIISSKNGNTSVLIGTTIRQYYLRGDGGALINESLGPDLLPHIISGKFADATCAHKADIVLVTPQRPGYQSERRLTIGDFYQNELFREVWCIPVESWIFDTKTQKYVEGKMTNNVLGTFLMRGRSKDEFTKLLQPFEEEAFVEWQINKAKLQKQYKSAAEFATAKMIDSISNSIYTFTIQKDDGGMKPYHFLEWASRAPKNDTEKEVLEIAQTIGGQYEQHLVNEVVEKGASKALEGQKSNGAALPAGK